MGVTRARGEKVLITGCISRCNMVNSFFFVQRKELFLRSFKSYFEISLKRSNRLLLLSPSNYRVHNVPFFLVKGTGGEKF